MLSWFAFPVLARCSVGWLVVPLIVQATTPEPDSFFWAGILTALVPLLVLGALGGVAVRLYMRERAGAGDERSEKASGPA